MPRSVSSANGRGAALLSAAFAATACTSILGIDGNYYEQHTTSDGSTGGGKTIAAGGKTSAPTKTGGTSNVAHHDAGSGGVPGNGGAPSSGGSAPDASAGGHTNRGDGGNETSAGGASTGGHDNGGSGGISEAGGTSATGGGGSTAMPPEDAGVCPLGTYMGTYSGKDHPSTSIGGMLAQIAGSITLRFTATSASGRAVTGGVAYLLTATSGGFAGAFVGTFDCETRTGSVSLIDPTNITTVSPPLGVVPIDGTFQIQPAANDGLKGTFSIHESLNPTATGSGTWATN